tara:strand:+ start:881 stop:1180 length:300 start_codon:yes stop_codon:yes gene_type:complete
MQINITSKHLDMTSSIEQYIQAKSSKLTRFYDKIKQIDVKIEKTTHGFIAEILTDIEHYDDIISNSEDDDLYAAIDLCVDRSVRQLTDLKNRIKDHHKN